MSCRGPMQLYHMQLHMQRCTLQPATPPLLDATASNSCPEPANCRESRHGHAPNPDRRSRTCAPSTSAATSRRR